MTKIRLTLLLIVIGVMGCSAQSGNLRESLTLDALCHKLIEMQWPITREDLDAVVTLAYEQDPNVGLTASFNSGPFITSDGFKIEKLQLSGDGSRAKGAIHAVRMTVAQTPCYKLDDIKKKFDVKPYGEVWVGQTDADASKGFRHQHGKISANFFASERSNNCVILISIRRTGSIELI